MIQPSLFDSGQRDEFLKRMRAGEKFDCPCCRRHAQIYKRAMHYTTAWQLIKLYRLNGYGQYINANQLIMEGQQGVGDFSKAKYWDLIERRPLGENETDKKSSGWWRLTPEGAAFVLGNQEIRKVALIFDDKLLEYEGPWIGIKDALRQRFNYERLMTA